MISAGRFLTGSLVLLLALGGPGLLVHGFLVRGATPRSRAAHALAVIAGGLAVAITLEQLLGVVALFSRGPLAVVGLACGAGGLVLERGHTATWPERAAPSRADALVIAAAVAAVVARWGLQVRTITHTGIEDFDSLDYHLPRALAFAQSHRVGPIVHTTPGTASSYFPGGGELLHGLGMASYGSDVATLAVNLIAVVLAVLGAGVLGARLGRATTAVLVMSALLVTPLVVYSQAATAAVDILTAALLISAFALLTEARAAGKGTGDLRLLAVAAAAAGLAADVKVTALPAVAVFVVAALWPRPARTRAGVAALLGPVIACGGFWYVRNIALVGNPVPGLRIPGFTHTTFSLETLLGQKVSQYLTDTHVIRHFYGPGLHDDLTVLWPIVILVAVVALVRVVRPGGPDGVAAARRSVGIAGLLALAVYLVTPTSAGGAPEQPTLFAANVRYALPGLALVAVAAVGARRREVGIAVDVIAGAVLAFVTFGPTAYGLVRHPTQVAAVVIAVVVLTALALLGVPRLEERRTAKRVVAAGALLVVAAVAVGGGYVVARRESRDRYTAGVLPSDAAAVVFRSVHGVRVGVVGRAAKFQYTDPQLSNRIVYLGVSAPHGGFEDATTCSAFLTAAAHERVAYAVAAPYPGQVLDAPDWLRAVPGARVLVDHAGVLLVGLPGSVSAADCG